uniref:Replication factor A C-terminal domain-containing protein n=1 Tax=Chenopodium quinoa TaxID=63459 RepID=A0A803MQQ7_CHEQI
MIVNKSQGQTLSQVIVYLPQPCFSHGQLYVALSRAKKSDKVTVITPQPAEHHTSPEHCMKATLFGDECDPFQKVFEYKNKYEIANAQGPFSPEYIPIADVPKTSGQKDQFGRVADVSDINIVDESTGTRPMIISAWGQLATLDCELLKDWASNPLVVSLTSLKPATHRGFSLQSSMSTTIDPAPVGEKFEALRAWAHTHPDVIADFMARKLEFMNVGAEPVPTTLDQIISKTVDNTVQEEVYTITITIPDAQLSNIIAYIGCDGCGKRCGVTANVSFFCLHCPYKKCTSTERVNFTFDAADNTGTFRLTTFGPVCEQILQLPTSKNFERKIKVPI